MFGVESTACCAARMAASQSALLQCADVRLRRVPEPAQVHRLTYVAAYAEVVNLSNITITLLGDGTDREVRIEQIELHNPP